MAMKNVHLTDNHILDFLRRRASIGSEVHYTTISCSNRTYTYTLHLQLRSVTCNGAEENQAHRCDHTRGQVFLCSLAFIKRRLEIQKVKSTANASKKIKTNHHETFSTTHRPLSHP